MLKSIKGKEKHQRQQCKVSLLYSAEGGLVVLSTFAISINNNGDHKRLSPVRDEQFS